MSQIASMIFMFIIVYNFTFPAFLRENQPQEQKYHSISIPTKTNIIFLPIISKELPGYFVSPIGNDANPGTFYLPWKTISKAALMVHPGDSVYIREGIYVEAPRFTISGTGTNPIKILAYPGEIPVIEGVNQLPSTYTGLVSVFGDWVQISGLEIRNSKYVGLGLYGKHDTANKIFAHHNQKIGIHISGDYGVVENSNIWRNSIQNEFGISTSWSSGLVASRDSADGITEHAVMRKNVIWENWGQGINTHEANYIVIEDNIVHDSLITNIYIHDATNILCQRNFIYMNPASYIYGFGSNVGIMMGDEGNTPSANIIIINNISFGNSWNYALWRGTNIINNIQIANNSFVNGMIAGNVSLRGYHQNVRFENNIVQQDGDLPTILITLDPDVSFSHNLWSKPPIEAASGPGDIIADPQLSKTGDPFSVEWFIPASSSPAIDHALVIPEVVDDYFGNPRGALPDMGAIEYVPD
jgi:hypothetical protein